VGAEIEKGKGKKQNAMYETRGEVRDEGVKRTPRSMLNYVKT